MFFFVYAVDTVAVAVDTVVVAVATVGVAVATVAVAADTVAADVATVSVVALITSVFLLVGAVVVFDKKLSLSTMLQPSLSNLAFLKFFVEYLLIIPNLYLLW